MPSSKQVWVLYSFEIWVSQFDKKLSTLHWYKYRKGMENENPVAAFIIDWQFVSQIEMFISKWSPRQGKYWSQRNTKKDNSRIILHVFMFCPGPYWSVLQISHYVFQVNKWLVNIIFNTSLISQIPPRGIFIWLHSYSLTCLHPKQPTHWILNIDLHCSRGWQFKSTRKNKAERY